MLKNISHFVLVFSLVVAWIFSGWPKIFDFPPEIEKVQAAACNAPTIALAAGSYTGIQTSTITAACSTICYTINGATPTAASNACTGATLTYSGAITIDHSLSIKAVAISSSKTISSMATKAYTITVNTPIFGTNGGSFDNDTSSTISDAFTGATICYTTDGSTPGATTPGTCNASPTQTYSTAVPITATGITIKAIGTKAGSTNSALATSNAFTLTVGAVTSSPGAGTYTSQQSVTLSIANTTGAVVYYTTDGSAVSCTSPTYSSAFNITTTATVKAIGCKTNYASSSAISDLYTISPPSAPTNVSATKTLSDKVTITWTKSTGATDYHVWRDATDLGSAGDVATFDDTGTEAPTITAGTASATDGSATDRVTLSISGAGANNGTSHTYKVVASSTAGNSPDSLTDTGYRAPGTLTYQWHRSSTDADSGYGILSGATTATYDDTTMPAGTITPGTASATDGTSAAQVSLSVSGQSANVGAGKYFYATLSATGAVSVDTNHDRGYRGVGSLTYQWQRSAGDSDAVYSDIAGATTASYNDTGAPADGSGRYYKVVENATGATQQISSSDRGYKQLISISLTTDGSVNFGYLPVNTAKDSTLTGVNDVEVVRVDSGPANLDIKSSIFSQGGNTWTLGTGNGNNIVKWEFSKDGTNWNIFTVPDSLYTLDTNVSQSSTRNIYFKITTPTATNSYQQYGTTITIVASAP